MNARKIGAGTTFLSPTDFYVEVDTSAGAVTIVLPSILTIMETVAKLGITFAGIRFLDISNNASVNNITIIGGSNNKVNDLTSIILNTNGVGGIFNILNNNEWSYNQNTVGGGQSVSKRYVASINWTKESVTAQEILNELGGSVSVKYDGTGSVEILGLIGEQNKVSFSCTASSPTFGMAWKNANLIYLYSYNNEGKVENPTEQIIKVTIEVFE
jgi:hypothetical protein